MTDWTSGYVADIGYTYGYYKELNPIRGELAFLASGLAFPKISSACELGFGQGISANIHAAGSVTDWYGTDFNPSQTAFAKELAQTSGAKAHLYDDAFTEFVARTDLPEFDYIGLHGIWSWISDENRESLVNFIKQKLKVGGVLYISYNTFPGWAAFAPIRKLMTEYSDVLAVQGQGTVHRVNEAVDFVDRLLATNPNYLKSNPVIAERVKNLKDQDRNYLAHEYFNRDWLPMHFADLVEKISAAKVQYACSAHYADHVDSINLTPDQQTFLSAIPDTVFRENARDFMTNQQFRRDYFVKGARRLDPKSQADRLRALRVILVRDRSEITLKANGSLGEAVMNEAIYVPILDVINDHRVHSFHQIELAIASHGIGFFQLVQALMLLEATGCISCAQDDALVQKSKPQTDRLNSYFIKQAHVGSDFNYLASPVTGGGIAINRFSQLFLAGFQQGKKTADELALAVWAILVGQGQKIIKDGAILEETDDNIAEIKRQAEAFLEKQVKIYKNLRIVV